MNEHTTVSTSAVRARRAYLTLAIALALALAAQGNFLNKVIPRGKAFVRNDEIDQYLERFAPLKASLPARGAVGYTSDSDDVRDYYLTQYALAPLAVVNRSGFSLVVGNYATTAAAPANLEAGRLRLIATGGEGIVLYQAVEQ